MENFIQKYSAIVFVLIIIFGEYYAFVFYFCRFYLELGALFSFLYLSIFHLFFGLLCISYFRSIFTSAGNVNYFEQQNLDVDEIKEFTQKYLNYKTNSKKRLKEKDFESQLQFNISNEIEMINKYTYCFKCQIIRPPRAHHCRKCDQCFNRMDHHCQWVGNCVGKQNHKFFILFLFYASITLLIVWSTIAYQKLFGMFKYCNNRPKNLQQRIELIITINISSSLPLFLAIFYLLIFNIQCAFLNITTIESHIDEIKTQKNPFKKMSYIENLKDIFGYNLQFFFLPIKPLFNYEYYQECI